MDSTGKRNSDTSGEPIAKRTRSKMSVGQIDLHPVTCTNTLQDILKMKETLRLDPDSLNRPQSISATDDQDWFPHKIPPICDASWMRHPNCVQFLLSQGAECCGAIALLASFLSEHVVITEEENMLKIVRMLLEYEPIERSRGIDSGVYSLMLKMAVENNWNQVLQLLLEGGAVVDTHANLITVLANMERTPFAAAICKSNFEGMKLLLFHGASTVLRIDSRIANQDYCIQSLPHFVVGYALDSVEEKACIGKQNELLSVLRVYRSLGGDLWTTCKDPDFINIEDDTLLDFIHRRPALIEKYPYMTEQVEKIMKNPPSLLSLSRVAIKKSMGRNYWKNLVQLPVPADLKPYLQYNIKYLEPLYEKNPDRVSLSRSSDCLVS